MAKHIFMSNHKSKLGTNWITPDVEKGIPSYMSVYTGIFCWMNNNSGLGNVTVKIYGDVFHDELVDQNLTLSKKVQNIAIYILWVYRIR